jgi:hypothetical protein
MDTLRQRGSINVLLIPLIFMILLFIAAAAFGYWAYNSREDYKNNVDQKIAAQVHDAKKQASAQKDKEYAKKAKYPFRTYKGPADYGSIILKYPKTWSAYVDERNNGSYPVNGYFHPGFVPGVQDPHHTFAVRLRVLQQSYNSVLKQYKGKVHTGKVKTHPYRSPNVAHVVGTKLTGQIQPQKQGEMIVMPFRDKTLELWTESTKFKDDFNNIILKNFDFSP